MLLKKFKFSQKEPSHFKIVFFRNKKFFVFKNDSSESINYLHIPNSIKIKKEASFFIFSIEVSTSNKILENFYNSFILFLIYSIFSSEYERKIFSKLGKSFSVIKTEKSFQSSSSSHGK